MSGSFDEVQVFGGQGERTGRQVDRKGVRGSQAVCRSVTELARKARRLGDGYYYLASAAWPGDATSLDLSLNWTTIC